MLSTSICTEDFYKPYAILRFFTQLHQKKKLCELYFRAGCKRKMKLMLYIMQLYTLTTPLVIIYTWSPGRENLLTFSDNFRREIYCIRYTVTTLLKDFYILSIICIKQCCVITEYLFICQRNWRHFLQWFWGLEALSPPFFSYR